MQYPKHNTNIRTDYLYSMRRVTSLCLKKWKSARQNGQRERSRKSTIFSKLSNDDERMTEIFRDKDEHKRTGSARDSEENIHQARENRAQETEQVTDRDRQTKGQQMVRGVTKGLEPYTEPWLLRTNGWRYYCNLRARLALLARSSVCPRKHHELRRTVLTFLMAAWGRLR